MHTIIFMYFYVHMECNKHKTKTDQVIVKMRLEKEQSYFQLENLTWVIHITRPNN